MAVESSAKDNKLVKEMLDLIENDSENLERTMSYLTEDCVWVMEPGGTEYHSSREIRAFVDIAMSSRSHPDEQHKIKITHWFANDENLCVEYTHGAKLTGKFTAGWKGGIKTGILRYCITYHMRNGKIDLVHEYIDANSFWYNLLLPLLLGYLHWLAMRKLPK
ncbi:MAG TPA: nuclear transport factor 2 family protein [Candidatus Limnocylindrales bacterium]|nr:nuclear transport factor 2 family protein [Candidatus Limnocylindrales bacterium]